MHYNRMQSVTVIHIRWNNIHKISLPTTMHPLSIMLWYRWDAAQIVQTFHANIEIPRALKS
jgi:hypothetical protein